MAHAEEDRAGREGVAVGRMATDDLHLEEPTEPFEAQVPPRGEERMSKEPDVEDGARQPAQPGRPRRPVDDREIKAGGVRHEDPITAPLEELGERRRRRRSVADVFIADPVNGLRRGGNRSAGVHPASIASGRGGLAAREGDRGERDDRVALRIESGSLDVDRHKVQVAQRDVGSGRSAPTHQAHERSGQSGDGEDRTQVQERIRHQRASVK